MAASRIPQQVIKALRSLRWLPAYAWQRVAQRQSGSGPVHLVIAVTDHFEPSIVPFSYSKTTLSEQERRVERWCTEYPKAVGAWRDSDGQPLRRTYFFPAEQYDKALIDALAAHCREGWGEIEIHLHHGERAPDTAQGTRRILTAFRDTLVAHGCLSTLDGEGPPRYAFVHGNWALANSANNRFCGVDQEMAILAETGCYADATLPSAPHPAQTAKINSLYECALPLSQRAPHRRGRDLSVGRPPGIFPLIIQGPLGLAFDRRRGGSPIPSIENGQLTAVQPPTMARLVRWRRANVVVRGRPDWLFIKLHCHGMDPRDEEMHLGTPTRQFLQQLTTQGDGAYRVHFVVIREMVNIILAACDGRVGNPGDYRDYRLRLIKPL